jgi:hypothetical protein
MLHNTRLLADNWLAMPTTLLDEEGPSMSRTTLSVRHDEPIGPISPRLYGHLAKHLGRCCYDGL